MKRIIGLMVLFCCMSMVVSAQDKSKATDMTGTICDQKCIKQDTGKAACDLSCTEQSGNAVFLDDNGKVWNVTNPTICAGKMGKKVKVQCQKMKDQDSIQILSIYG